MLFTEVFHISIELLGFKNLGGFVVVIVTPKKSDFSNLSNNNYKDCI